MRITLAVALAMVIAVLAPTSAQAASAGVSDPKNDVFVYDWMTDDAEYGWWNPDISKVRVSHTSRRIATVTRFHRLGKHPWETFTVYVDTDQDKAPEYRMEIGDGSNGVYRGRFGWRQVCGVSSHVNYADKLVRLSAPLRCFKNPGAVRVKAEFWDTWGPDCCNDWATDDTHWTAKVRRG